VLHRDPLETRLESVLVGARPRLVRALLAVRGVDGAEDAAAEAIAWGWEHGARIIDLENPVGYLYRVALTRSSERMQPVLPPVEPATMRDIEPALVPALLALPERQRAAVWLVHACDWTYSEVADALDIGRSTVGTHVTQALESLRKSLDAEATDSVAIDSAETASTATNSATGAS